MARRATVSGQFYASEQKELERQIVGCFKGKFGSGMPGHKKNKKIYGIIAPHAGYEYSGQCASWAYREIAESENCDVFIIIGVNHQSPKSGVIISMEDFETPFGVVKNEKSFARKMIEESKSMKLKKLSLSVIQDEDVHAFEHSIEVQLPFLQYVIKNSGDLRIVPIILSDYTYDGCKSLAQLIAEVSKQLKKKICIIASSDFTHYGPNYDFTPFSSSVKENMYKMDGLAVKKIMSIDGKGFFDYSKNITICGAGSITAAIEACKILGAKKAELLKYYTSGDVINDYKNAVGYSSVVFR